MTTKIETIYANIVTQLGTSLGSSYRRLPNPYDINANDFLKLQKGFAIAVGSGQDTQRYLDCLVTWERVFSIILVNQVNTTLNNIGSREIIEKDLLVDHDILRKAFHLNTTLGGQAIKSIVLDDSGIQFLDAGRQKFLQLSMNLYVEYQETPS